MLSDPYQSFGMAKDACCRPGKRIVTFSQEEERQRVADDVSLFTDCIGTACDVTAVCYPAWLILQQPFTVTPTPIAHARQVCQGKYCLEPPSYERSSVSTRRPPTSNHETLRLRFHRLL
jgi:hypothetical protein